MILLGSALAIAQAQPAAGCPMPPPPGGMGGPPPGGMPFGRSSDGGLAERYNSGAYDAVLRAQGMSDAGIAAIRATTGQVEETGKAVVLQAWPRKT